MYFFYFCFFFFFKQKTAYEITHSDWSSDVWSSDLQRQFYLEQARSFAWGLQPTIANFRASQLVDRPDETGYMMRLARIRARALDYLLYGTFLRPPGLTVPLVDVDLSRVSIYAAQR